MLSKKIEGLVPRTKEKEIMKHFKDKYILDFLGLKDEFLEKDLRKAIVQNLKQFFLEFGRYFLVWNFKVTKGQSRIYHSLCSSVIPGTVPDFGKAISANL